MIAAHHFVFLDKKQVIIIIYHYHLFSLFCQHTCSYLNEQFVFSYFVSQCRNKITNIFADGDSGKRSFENEISCCYNLKAKTLWGMHRGLWNAYEKSLLFVVKHILCCTSLGKEKYYPLLFPPTVSSICSSITGRLSTPCWPEESLSHWVWWWQQVSSAPWMVSCRDTTCCTVLSLMMNGQLTIAIKLVGALFFLCSFEVIFRT